MAPKTTDDLLAGNDPLFTAVDGVALCSLTKRELFAAMAMQGLLSNGSLVNHPDEQYIIGSVKAADALLTELAKPQGV